MTVPKGHHRTKEQVRAHKGVIKVYESRIPSTDVMGRKMTSDWCRNLKVLHLVGVSSDSPVEVIKLLQYELQPGHAQKMISNLAPQTCMKLMFLNGMVP